MQPGITVKSNVIAGRLRDRDNKLTPFFSGERFVFVKGGFPIALPSIMMLGKHKCRVLHRSQERACMRCRRFDHHTTDTTKCDAILDDDVCTIKSPLNSMCNYFEFPINVFKNDFPTSEHAYQWGFLTHIEMHDLAREVLNARTAAEAKAIASRVPSHLHKDWHAIKTHVMREILHAKADYCPIFKADLLNSAGSRLVEAVRGDIFWSSGLPPQLAASTKPSYFPGKNVLGRVLEQVRNDLMKEAVLGDEIEKDDMNLQNISFNRMPTDQFNLPPPNPALLHIALIPPTRLAWYLAMQS